MAYDPNTGMWKPEDDSVANNLTGLLDKNSTYIQGARQQGLASANRRGLLNSTMGAEAGQSAAINAALPIAQQDASQTTQKNLSAQSYTQTGALNQGQYAAQKEQLQISNQASMDQLNKQIAANRDQYTAQIAADNDKLQKQIDATRAEYQANIQAGKDQQAAQSKAQMEQLQAQLEASKQQQQSDLAAKEKEWQAQIQASQEQQAKDLVAQQSRLQEQLNASKAQYEAEIAAGREQQAAQAKAQMDQLQEQLSAQQEQNTASIASNEKIANLDAQTKASLANLDSSTRLTIANMNVQSNAQDKAMAAAVSYAQIYGQENAAIMGNENIPAATRTAYINQAKNRLNTGLNLVEQVYNVKLDWGQVASVAGVNAQAAGGGAPVSVGTPGGGAPVSVGGPYSLPGTGASYGVNAGGGFAGPNFSGLNRI